MLEICADFSCGPLNFKNFLPLYMKYLISPEYPLDHKYAYIKAEALGSNQLTEQDAINRGNIALYLDGIEKMEKIGKLSDCLQTLQWHKKRLNKLGKTVTAEVLGIKLGDTVLLSAPVEPVNAVGRLIYDRYADKNIFFAAYSNGYIHYGATPEQYAKGGYETCECDLAPEWLGVYFGATDEILEKIG